METGQPFFPDLLLRSQKVDTAGAEAEAEVAPWGASMLWLAAAPG
jgi:hypothetical protein